MKNFKRNIIIASVTVILSLPMFTASGCGGDESSSNTSTVSTGTVSTAATTTSAQTQTTGGTSSSAMTETTVSPAGPSGGSPAGNGTQDTNQVPLQIIAQNASPETVSPGGSVTITCTVKGNASSASVEIMKKMDSSFSPVSYALAEGITSGDSTIWSATVPAPSVAGLFAFSTFATDAGGTTVKNQLGQGPYDGPGVYFQVQ